MTASDGFCGKALRGFFLSCVAACLFTGCSEPEGRTGKPAVTIGVTASLETIAGTLLDSFSSTNVQQVTYALEVVPDSELRTVLENESVAAIIQWREPPAEEWSAQIGWTGICFFVHPENPVEDISSEQIQRIYLGWTGRWTDVGGDLDEIHAMAFEPDTDIGALFEEAVLGGNRLGGGVRIVPSAYSMPEAVSDDPFAIGFLPMDSRVSGVRVLTIDSTAADYAGLLTGTYPFRIPIYLVAREAVSAEILSLAGWMQSVSGQTVLLQLHTQE